MNQRNVGTTKKNNTNYHPYSGPRMPPPKMHLNANAPMFSMEVDQSQPQQTQQHQQQGKQKSRGISYHPYTGPTQGVGTCRAITQPEAVLVTKDPVYADEISGRVVGVEYTRSRRKNDDDYPSVLYVETQSGVDKYYITNFLPRGNISLTVNGKECHKGQQGFRPAYRRALKMIRPGDAVTLSRIVGKNQNSRCRAVNAFHIMKSLGSNDMSPACEAQSTHFMAMPCVTYANRILAASVATGRVWLFRNRTGVAPLPGTFFRRGVVNDLVLVQHPFSTSSTNAASSISGESDNTEQS